MLEIINLTKTYKLKKAENVTALNGVTLKFPEKGMVFLLGKSGSGKSTLLHMLGGLDTFDSGKLLIKGKSTENFTQKQMDSYRNTYVGFIFQDYNVLNEFTVGANVALAIELQNRKATNKEISDILSRVDLQGFGSRKPNELSGGQKQRVAIARALVKNPRIIMADEPTGALDSATGRQVLDTLKKLSAEKLVIVVSHDREFAEQYADRIIELCDGKVIADNEFVNESANQTGVSFAGNCITVPEKYQLSEQDRIDINNYLKNLTGDAVITPGHHTLRKSVPVNNGSIAWRDTSPLALIRSKLPMKSAFKIGASGLKYKKIRLVITIFLSCIAFGLFGLADTFAAYNHIKTCTNSIIDSGITYAAMQKQQRNVRSEDNYVYYTGNYKLNDADLEKIKNDTGITVNGVFIPRGWNLDFLNNYDESVKFTQTEYHIYPYGFVGFSEITADRLKDMNYKILCGRLPSGTKDEIGISKYIAETFIKGGYRQKGEKKFTKIGAAEDMLNKTLYLNGKNYTVTCIIDTNFDFNRYLPLTIEKEGKTNADDLLSYALFAELAGLRQNSFLQVAFVGDGFVKELAAKEVTTLEANSGWAWYNCEDAANNFYCSINASYFGTVNDIKHPKAVTYFGGRKSLKPDEILVAESCLSYGGKMTEEQLANATFTLECGTYSSGEVTKAPLNGKKYVVAGIINDAEYPQYKDTVISADGITDYICTKESGIYNYCVGNMPKGENEVKNLVSYCYQTEPEYRYSLQNSVTFELDTVNDVLKDLSIVFLFIGIGFAAFAAIMFANFISTSVAYKKNDIGILRAIGSRSADVFRIFFSESFIIAVINFVLSAAGVYAVTAVINYVIRIRLGFMITLLNFGIRQIALLFIISMFIAAAASFIPVKIIASKKPIEAIRSVK